jgi:GT2 family glycosyltransferase
VSLDRPSISVVITNFNRRDDLRQALLSVLTQRVKPEQVTVVDNASTDGSTAMLSDEFPNVQVLALSENTGMDGYTHGFQVCTGDIVFQMDNDAELPDSDVLSRVVEAFQAAPSDVAVIATRVEEYRPGDDVGALRRRDVRSGPLADTGFHSGGVAFRRAALDEVGGYNRDVFLYGSELFLEMKLLAAGYRIVFHPEILVLHKSSGTARSTRGVYYEVRNRYWFMRSFASGRQLRRFLPAMILHDAIYGTWKIGLGAAFRALWDGFGRLPESLVVPLHSANRDFVRKVDRVGEEFRIGKLLPRIMSANPGLMRRKPGGGPVSST